MARVRVYSLAKELQVDNQRIIELARELGSDVSKPSNVLDDQIAEQIRELQASMSAPPPSAPAAVEPAKPLDTAAEESAAETSAAATPAPSKPPAHSPASKRSYLIDGLNVCNWGKETTLAPLLTLLVELKRRGHPFVCICDANTRFVLEERGERAQYEHLLNTYDCIGEVPGGTQADDFLLFRAHKTGEAIITNDQYRDPRYRERYKWLRSISPRLCKGIVVGGYLMIPELDMHLHIRDNLGAIIKEFEALFGRAKPHTGERREAHGRAPGRAQQGRAVESKTTSSAEPEAEPKQETGRESRQQPQHQPRNQPRNQPRPQPRPASRPEPRVETPVEAPPALAEPAGESAGATPGADQPPRPRSRRRRRRGGKRPAGVTS